MTYNQVLLSGEINNVLINNKYITMGLTCRKYSRDENNNVVYASLRIYKELYDKNKGLFFIGNKIYVKGYLNSYSDKNKKIHNYVTVTKIEDYDFENISGPVIGVDYDGVETWNGKRLEPDLATEEEIAEIKELIKLCEGGNSSE